VFYEKAFNVSKYWIQFDAGTNQYDVWEDFFDPGGAQYNLSYFWKMTTYRLSGAGSNEYEYENEEDREDVEAYRIPENSCLVDFEARNDVRQSRVQAWFASLNKKTLADGGQFFSYCSFHSG